MSVVLKSKKVKGTPTVEVGYPDPPPTESGGTGVPDLDLLAYPVQLIALDQIKESERNSKVHTPHQIDEIIRSIKEFGFRDPVALDGSWELVEGHGRVAALRKMGATHVPAMVFTDLSPEQIRAYRIAHNQLTLSTGFDISSLAVELRDLDLTSFDIRTTGFTLDDLASFELQLDSAHGVVSGASTPTPDPSDDPVDADAPAASGGGQEVVNYQYIIIFDNKEQQTRWNAFLKHLKGEIEGETAAERLDVYLQNEGF